MSTREQRQQLKEKKRIQEERDQRQFEQQAHQQNIQSARDKIEEEKGKYLDKLMQTGMTDAGINLLDNMLDRSFILGNIDEAEYHDIKWEMRVMYLKIKAEFPPEESVVKGKLRAFVTDDPDEGRKPLTGQQRIMIVQMIRGITLLVSRSKGGFQQEMNVKSINVSEVLNPDEEEDDRVKLGLFGG